MRVHGKRKHIQNRARVPKQRMDQDGVPRIIAAGDFLCLTPGKGEANRMGEGRANYVDP